MKVKHVGELCFSQISPIGGAGGTHGVFIEATADELENLAPHFEVLAGRPVEIHVDKAAEFEAMLDEGEGT
jgi:hypothetical protein